MGNHFRLIEQAKVAGKRAVDRRLIEQELLAFNGRQVAALEQIAEAMTALARYVEMEAKAESLPAWELDPKGAPDDDTVWAE